MTIAIVSDVEVIPIALFHVLNNAVSRTVVRVEGEERSLHRHPPPVRERRSRPATLAQSDPRSHLDLRRHCRRDVLTRNWKRLSSKSLAFPSLLVFRQQPLDKVSQDRA